jgi:virulence factor Mce-like protein
MITRSPSIRVVLTLATFATACVGLAIYLWLSFGGQVPFAPAGYHLYVPFANAAGLADQADVRISGVNVGKVVATTLDRRTERTIAELDISSEYAPRPGDTRATLRQKSALGELYVELSPGNPATRKLPDGGMLAPGQVAPAVSFSAVLQTFDPATRRALTTWLTQQGVALRDSGQALNSALYDLTPLTTHAGALLRVMHDEQASSDALIGDGGTVLSALTERQGQLAALVQNTDTVFAALAAQRAELARTISALPGFLSTADTTLRDVATFSRASTPVIQQLQPAARALGPVLVETRAVAPALRQLLIGIGPLARSSRAGNQALGQLLALLDPVLGRAKPYLGGIVPILRYLGLDRRELAGFLANAASATEATLPGDYPGPPLHYLRTSVPVNPEALAAYPYHLSSTRSDPYIAPGTALTLAHGLPVFGRYLCASHPDPSVSPQIPSSLRQQILMDFFTSNPGGPPCLAQPSLGPPTTGQARAFPQLQALP